MYKKLLALSIVMIFVVSLFIGCSANYKSDNAMETTTGMSRETSQGDLASGSNEKYLVSDEKISPEVIAEEFERKLIKNGSIAVEVINVDNTYEKVTQLIKDIGGYEFSSSFTVNDDLKRMVITIKMLPENIEKFKATLKDIIGEGKITSTDIYSDDITDQYYDSKSRLNSLIVSRDRLVKLLEKAEITADVLEIEREITNRNQEIESIQGRINMWDKLVSMATITLYIDQMNDPLKHTKTVGFEFNSFTEIWNTVKSGFISVVNVLYNIIIWIFIILVAASPILIIAFIVIFIIRKRKKKNAPR